MANNTNVTKLRTILSHLHPEQAVLIRGPHGIGKSAVVKQVAKERGAEFIDIRLGQMTEGDLLGIPFIKGGGGDGDSTGAGSVSTVTTVPSWYVKAMERPSVLFFDELNRALPTVLQGVFQIILDRCIQDNKLHPDTLVVAAINTGKRYDVIELDPALLDRFAVFDFAPTVAEFLTYADDNFLPVINKFLMNNSSVLDDYKENEDIQASRRSWEMVDRSMKHAASKGLKLPPVEFFTSMLGVTVSQVFHTWLLEQGETVSEVSKVVSYDMWKAFKTEVMNKLNADKKTNQFENREEFLIQRQKQVNQFLAAMSPDNLINLLDTITLSAERSTAAFLKDKKDEKVINKFMGDCDDMRLFLCAQVPGSYGDIPCGVHPENVIHLDIVGKKTKKPVRTVLNTQSFMLGDDDDRIMRSPRNWLIPWGTVETLEEKVRQWGDSSAVSQFSNMAISLRGRFACEESGQIDIVKEIDDALAKAKAAGKR